MNCGYHYWMVNTITVIFIIMTIIICLQSVSIFAINRNTDNRLLSLSSSYQYQNRRQMERNSQQSDDGLDFSFSQENIYINNEDDVNGTNNESSLPEFVGHVPNVTAQVGREARLACIIRNLASYSAAWIRDDLKSILTLQTHIITRDPRISLLEESQIDSQTAGGYVGLNGNDFLPEIPGSSLEPMMNRIRYFILVIRNVQFSDRGGYMCQINTVPLRKQIGYLRVVVPPDIIDHESSNDVLVREGDNVTLRCKARGYPEPVIEWRREDGARVPLGNRSNGHNNRHVMVNKTEGELLEIARVTRVHSGAWLCIASNGVMPSVSRRILLNVQFVPQIWIPIEEIGAPFGSNITLDCHIEAYPLPLNYWTFGSQSQSIYISGPKYEVSVKEKGYKRHLKLTIQSLSSEDLGLYQCHAHNSLGRQVKQVKVYSSKIHQQSQSKWNPNDRSQQPPLPKRVSSTSIDPMTTTTKNNDKSKRKRKRKKIKLTTTIPRKEWSAVLDGGPRFNDKLMMTNISDRNFDLNRRSSKKKNIRPSDDDDEYYNEDDYYYDEDDNNYYDDCVHHKFEMFFMMVVIFNTVLSIPRYFLY
ncbi:uncharacterized protein LOC142645167 isoform X1 [Dermatophagoides pteronyssinus]|uniref:uncharacterized protein LOC142645167 isoform X1 n=1 Tax=Dermatophagoides pteronyssinus TaxID=6956 RepID=UPI003F66DF34